MLEKKRYPITALDEAKREPGQIILTAARCGDKDRNETADFLGDMFSQGYLSQPEFEARKNAALQAVTWDQLKILRSDLPVTLDSWRIQRHEVAVQPPEPKRKFRPSDAIVLVFGLIVLSSAVTGFFTVTGVGSTGLMIQMLIGIFLIASGFPDVRKK